MDFETAAAITSDRLRDLRSAGAASRRWRPTGRSADHPTLRRRPSGPTGSDAFDAPSP